MKQVESSIVINRSSHEVFLFIINPDNTPRWVNSVVKEEVDKKPIKKGTIYRNQGLEGNWSEFEVSAFEDDKIFEIIKKDDRHYVRYTFSSLDKNQCKLGYSVRVDCGEISERFSQQRLDEILQRLKIIVESVN